MTLLIVLFTVGASIATIIKKLSGQFLLLIGIAFLIGLSLSFYFMGNWLENFSYQTSLSLWIFLVAGLAVILVTFLTIGYQGLLAAIQNPVNSLREP